MTKTIHYNGSYRFICGYLNTRHCMWDRVCNKRGNAVHKVTNMIPNTYVLVIEAMVPTYYKIVNKDGGGTEVHSRNPDIGISRSPEPTAHIAEKDWGSITDHIPIRFTVKAKMDLKYMRKRITKSIVYVPKAFERDEQIYRDR